MISRENYYERIKGVSFKQFDADMNSMKEMVDQITRKGSDWTAYENDTTVKETFDLYFQALALELKDAKSEKKPSTKPTPKKEVKRTKAPVKRQKKRQTTKPDKKAPTKPTANPNAKKVEAFSDEIKFMKRFMNMDGKLKNRNQIRLFINALQKAIRERRITKTSPYAKQIMEIQDSLIRFHKRFKTDNQKEPVSYSDATRTKYLTLIGRQIELLSVKLIKSYINLQGKIIPNQKAKNLHNRIANAINKSKLTKRDKYWKEVQDILGHLKTFVQKNPNHGLLTIETRTLNGLEAVVGCPCETAMNGITSVPDDVILTGKEIAALKFDTLEFEGKWKDFMGRPNRGFSFMLSAKPKYGKTILAMQFADYLANNFGSVLYIASEEQIGATLQQKVLEGKYFHPDLFFTGTLPEDFSAFDFVFIDSVNNYGLTVEDLKRLKRENPSTSFGYIFQVTKDGVFRGSNEFQHDVDSVWEIPERGQAVQFGRYNQGGSMPVFENDKGSALDGVKKKQKY